MASTTGEVDPSIPVSDQHVLAKQGPDVRLHAKWQVLGPFQIGTREAVWGADPLASSGGFSSLQYHPNASVASSLVSSGFAGWSEHTFEPHYSAGSSSAVTLDVEFATVDWRGMKDVYGWAGFQAQAWARATFDVLTSEATQRIALHVDNVVEYFIDKQHHFGGDLFSFRRTPVILELAPGRHTIHLRLTKDARATGAVGDMARLEASIALRLINGNLQVNDQQNIVPDVINGNFASAFASISLQNSCEFSLDVLDVHAVDPSVTVSLLSPTELKLEPGQSRPVALRLITDKLTLQSLVMTVTYRLHNEAETRGSISTSVGLTFRNKEEAHVFTYIHPSGIVSHAIIRPPSHELHSTREALPVLVNLHGAGLAVNTPQMMHSLDEVSDLPAWFVYPSGVTTWCGDDWHHWGWGDARAAISAVPQWIQHNDWMYSNVDIERLFVIGHSNGGQGVLQAATHWPDSIVTAASASGYLSIQSYVPFQLWRESDPLRSAIIHASMNDYRHELLSSNIKHMPLLLQHGDADDNVPPYHSRRLGQLLQEKDVASNYSELPGKEHWWEGAQVTRELREFYRTHVRNPRPSFKPTNFTFVVASPSNTGSKSGLRVERIATPGQLSKVVVTTIKEKVLILTSNVLEISIPNAWLRGYEINIDGQAVILDTEDDLKERYTLTRDPAGTWCHESTREADNYDLSNRRLGNGLHAILNTPSRIGIKAISKEARLIAVSIAQSLYQYLAADAVISDISGNFHEETGDVITIGIGSSVESGIMANHPIKLLEDEVIVRACDGIEKHYKSGADGIGAIFLRPAKNGLLQLVVWGIDADSLSLARRLVPMMTGVGQPDFVVLTGESKVGGIDGALAMGFFDAHWNVTRSSFLS